MYSKFFLASKHLVFLSCFLHFFQINAQDIKAQKISPIGYSYIDPEIYSIKNKLAFQMGNGNVWLSNLDSNTGFFNTDFGLDILVDVGATALTQSFNGPEFGIDKNGWSLVYTKQNGTYPQAWRALINENNITNYPLTSGTMPRLSILASKDPNALTTKILFSKGQSLSNGEFGWTDVNNPSSETFIDNTDNGVRWIDNTQKFFYIKQTGASKGQVFFYDTETKIEQQVTNDGDIKTYPYGWYAPEYNEIIFLALLNDTAIGIFKDNGNVYWDKILTIAVPSTSNFEYIGSPETFVANNKSYISFVTKIVATGSSYVDSEVWVVDIEPDIRNRFILRCDDGKPNSKRTDPESYLGAKEVFIYYNEINSNGEFEIWRYATGIPSKKIVSNIHKSEESDFIKISPNPVNKNEAFSLQINSQNKKNNIMIINSLGNVLYSFKINDKIFVNTSTMAKGVYYIIDELGSKPQKLIVN